MTGDANHGYVSWGRYDAEHQALLGRVSSLEELARSLGGVDQTYQSLRDKIAELEEAGRAEKAGERTRRERGWLIVVGLLTGIVCPLIVTSVITILHLRALKG
jgi:hypothetical protein